MTTEDIIKHTEAKIDLIQSLIRTKTQDVVRCTEGGRITSRDLLSFAQAIAQLEMDERASIEVRMALIQTQNK